jgi:hypothetical protein
MKVSELIEALGELESPDAEVRFASQPSWPFEYSIKTVEYASKEQIENGVEGTFDCNGRCGECADKVCDQPYQPETNDGPITVYLVEERQLGYLPSVVKDLIGW